MTLASQQISLADAEARVQEMIRQRAPLRDILTLLCSTAETLAANTVSSILLVDEHGLLRNGASPNLPADYLDAIDRLKPDPRVGAWSQPIKAGGRILGTFGTYFRTKRTPSGEERSNVASLAALAAAAIVSRAASPAR